MASKDRKSKEIEWNDSHTSQQNSGKIVTFQFNITKETISLR